MSAQPAPPLLPRKAPEQGLDCPKCGHRLPFLRAWTWESLEWIENTLVKRFAGQLILSCRNAYIWDIGKLIHKKVRE